MVMVRSRKKRRVLTTAMVVGWLVRKDSALHIHFPLFFHYIVVSFWGKMVHYAEREEEYCYN